MSERDAPPAEPDYSPWNRDDLNEAIAVILPVPRTMKDTYGGFDRKEYYGLLDEFRQDLTELLRAFGLDKVAESPPPRPYQIGPQAGPTFFVIFALQHADQFVHATADYLAWGGFALAVRQKWRERVNQHAPNTFLAQQDSPIYPRRLIEAICLADVHERYGLASRATMQAHSRDSYYTGGRRPTGASVHTIVIRSAGKIYVYVVNGHAKVIDHFMLDGTKVIPLALPERFPPY